MGECPCSLRSIIISKVSWATQGHSCWAKAGMQRAVLPVPQTCIIRMLESTDTKCALCVKPVLVANLPVGIASVDCNGTETSLLQCTSSQSAIQSCGVPGSSFTDATVIACANSNAMASMFTLPHLRSCVLHGMASMRVLHEKNVRHQI